MQTEVRRVLIREDGRAARVPLDDFMPGDSENFAFEVDAWLGPVDEERVHSFRFYVYSPSWLLRNPHEFPLIMQRSVVMWAFERHELLEVINVCLGRSERSNWEDVARALGQFMEWEFEAGYPREHCPCCGYLTILKRNYYERCPVCCWVDDGQDDDTADQIWDGPNLDLSLTQARRNFREFGAFAQTAVGRVRPPRVEELVRREIPNA